MELAKDFTYAVIGASHNHDKFGYKVFKSLLTSGLKVIPVNPKGGFILDTRVYSRLEDYSGKIDVVVFVVPPKITKKILLSVNKLGIDKVWMQPGSESKQAINYCQSNQIEVVYNACLMKAAENGGLS